MSAGAGEGSPTDDAVAALLDRLSAVRHRAVDLVDVDEAVRDFVEHLSESDRQDVHLDKLIDALNRPAA